MRSEAGRDLSFAFDRIVTHQRTWSSHRNFHANPCPLPTMNQTPGKAPSATRVATGFLGTESLTAGSDAVSTIVQAHTPQCVENLAGQQTPAGSRPSIRFARFPSACDPELRSRRSPVARRHSKDWFLIPLQHTNCSSTSGKILARNRPWIRSTPRRLE